MPSGEARRGLMRAQCGFGFVWTLLAVAALGIGLAAIGQLWSTQAQREREAELLFVGREFRAALTSYYVNSKVGTPAYPARLTDLLEDRRGPVLRRHLRKIYVDPITGREDWGLLRTPDGRILGVHSRSGAAPIKTGNFGPGESQFEKAETYADWRFEHVPPRSATPQRR